MCHPVLTFGHSLYYNTIYLGNLFARSCNINKERAPLPVKCFCLGLKLVHLLLGVAQLSENTSQTALGPSKPSFGAGNTGGHSRRSTDENLDVSFVHLMGHHFGQKLLGHVTLLVDTFVLRRGIADGIQMGESARVLLSQSVQLTLQEDIFFAVVCIDKSDLGLVVWVVENGSSQLVNRSDARSASDEGHGRVLVRLVVEFMQRLEQHRVTGLQ